MHAKIAYFFLVVLLYFSPQFHRHKTKIKALMSIKIGIDSDILQTICMRSGNSQLQIDKDILKCPLSGERLAFTDNVLVKSEPRHSWP